MTDRVQKLHKEVYDHFIKNTTSYKEEKDKKRPCYGTLNIKYVPSPNWTYGKLNDKQIGPCKALAKYDSNAYKIELPEELNINPVFIVADLKKYHTPDEFQIADPSRGRV